MEEVIGSIPLGSTILPRLRRPNRAGGVFLEDLLFESYADGRHVLLQRPRCPSGSAVVYFTWPRAKLERMLATPGMRVR